jgi:hypothetical protein
MFLQLATVVLDGGGRGGVHDGVGDEEGSGEEGEEEEIADFDIFVAGESEAVALAEIGVQAADLAQHLSL